jgi:hypothetical protein
MVFNVVNMSRFLDTGGKSFDAGLNSCQNTSQPSSMRFRVWFTRCVAMRSGGDFTMTFCLP